MEDKSHDQQKVKDPRDVILELNFVPQWARKPPGQSHYGKHDVPRESGRRERDGRRPDRRSDRRREERPRAPRDRRPPREPLRELPIKVSFLPEQKRLASLVRQIHHSRRAYPLMDLANLLIHDSEGYLVKIEVEKEANGFELYQCRRCKAVASEEAAMIQHVRTAHLTDFFDKEEVEGEPPSGQFPGVARCTRTGILLGPPNHHSYTEKVAEVHQARFPNLPLEDYKQSIEVLKDEALIEQWKEESRKKTLYRPKGDAEAEPMEARQAETEMSRKAPDLYEVTHRAVIPAKTAQQLEDRHVIHAIRQVWNKESRFPLTMSFAMRAAFRHMHLHLFKAGRINFVTHIKPNPVEPDETVENIAEVLRFLKEHPGSTRPQLLEQLHPSIDPKSKEAREALQPLGWLIERGHIIEFFNGTLSVPVGRRKRARVQ